MVVTVHAVEDDALAVDEQRTVVADGDRTEAYLQGAQVRHLLSLKELDAEVVEARRLGRPRLYGETCERQGTETCAILLAAGRADEPVSVAHLSHYACAARHIHVEAGLGTSVGSQFIGAEEEVADARLRCRPEQHVALYARQPPEVLALEERAAGETVSANDDTVLAGLPDVLRDVPFRRQERVLGITDEPAVHPHIVAVSHAIEADEHLATFPCGGQAERAEVSADGVLHPSGIRPVGGAVGHDAPCLLVHVERLVPLLAVSHGIDLPGTGHFDVGPFPV